MDEQLEHIAREIYNLGYKEIRLDMSWGDRIITPEFIIRLYPGAVYVINSTIPIPSAGFLTEQHNELLYSIKKIQLEEQMFDTVEIGPFAIDFSGSGKRMFKQQLGHLRKVIKYVLERFDNSRKNLLEAFRLTIPPPFFVPTQEMRGLSRAIDEVSHMKYKILLVNGKKGIGKETGVRHFINKKKMMGVFLDESKTIQHIVEEIKDLQRRVLNISLPVALLVTEILGDMINENFMFFYEQLWRVLQSFSQHHLVIVLVTRDIHAGFSCGEILKLKEPDNISAGLILEKKGAKFHPAPEGSRIGNPLYSLLIENKNQIVS